MNRRPTLLVLLALFHFFEPISKILVFKFSTGLPLDLVINNLLQMNHLHSVFDFWLLFPIGGLALLGVKAWTYPVFIGVQLYSAHLHLSYQSYQWPYLSEAPHAYSLIILITNFLMLIYIFSPDIRSLFFHPEKRWWETRVRHHVDIGAYLWRDGSESKWATKIANISQTGAFLQTERKDLGKGDIVHLKFPINDQDFHLTAQVVSRHEYLDREGLGVRFRFPSLQHKWVFQLAMRSFERKQKIKAQQLGHIA